MKEIETEINAMRDTEKAGKDGGNPPEDIELHRKKVLERMLKLA